MSGVFREWPGRGLAWLDTVAETWLGYALPPAERAVRESGWTPDEAILYCARCGDSAGPGECRPSGCAVCHRRAAPADRVVRLGPYEPPLRDWVLALKYDRWAEMGEVLGRLLARSLLVQGRIDRRRAIVVPMPMPWLRRLHRGLDHALVIGAAAAEELDVPLIPMLTVSRGPRQATLTGAARRRRGGRRMRLRSGHSRDAGGGAQLILIDDVRTTGSSLRAAARRLRGVRPREIIAAVVAVTDDPSRRRREGRTPHRFKTEIAGRLAVPGPPVLRPPRPRPHPPRPPATEV